MLSPEECRVQCEDPSSIVAVLNALSPILPLPVRREFNALQLAYLQRFGKGGLFERTNGRTVAEILDAYDARDSLDVIESGDREGVRYTLYAPPKASDDERSEQSESGNDEND